MFGRPFFAFHAAIVPKARLTLVQTAFWENDDQGSGWMSANRKLSAGWRKIPITLTIGHAYDFIGKPERGLGVTAPQFASVILSFSDDVKPPLMDLSGEWQ